MRNLLAALLFVLPLASHAQAFHRWVAPPMIQPSAGKPIRIEKEQFTNGIVIHMEHVNGQKPYGITLTSMDNESFFVPVAADYFAWGEAVIFLKLPPSELSQYKLRVIRQEGYSNKVVFDGPLSEITPFTE